MCTHIWLDWFDAPCSHNTSADKLVSAETANSNSPTIICASLQLCPIFLIVWHKMKKINFLAGSLHRQRNATNCTFTYQNETLYTQTFKDCFYYFRINDTSGLLLASTTTAIITTNVGEILAGLMNKRGGLKVNTIHA